MASYSAIFSLFVCLFGWFLNVLVNNQAISPTGPKTERLTILRAATHETEWGDHDFKGAAAYESRRLETAKSKCATRKSRASGAPEINDPHCPRTFKAKIGLISHLRTHPTPQIRLRRSSSRRKDEHHIPCNPIDRDFSDHLLM